MAMSNTNLVSIMLVQIDVEDHAHCTDGSQAQIVVFG